MKVGTKRRGGGLYPLAKRAAFALLRARQGAHLYRACPPDSSSELRVLHVGQPFRGRDLLQRLYGSQPEGRRIGGSWVGPLAPERASLAGRVDLIVVDINRLYAPRYRRAGYFTIPEWVEFGREVVADPKERYRGARKSLKCDLKALREAGFEATVSRRPEDFRLFCTEMYRPHLATRFGEGAIAKSTSRLRRDFEAGFLLMLLRGGEPVAGAILRIDGERLSQTTFGVRAGSAELLRSRASAAIDYHLHEWAAEHRMRFLNVGHTRPFPGDGIFFNKRKWLMSLFPDGDGVLDHALRWVGAEDHGHRVLARCPFVCGLDSGLGLLAVLPDTGAMNIEKTAKTVRGYWTEGLRVLLLVCPGGYLPGTVEGIREIHGPRVELYTRLDEAAAAYRRGIAV